MGPTNREIWAGECNPRKLTPRKSQNYTLALFLDASASTMIMLTIMIMPTISTIRHLFAEILKLAPHMEEVPHKPLQGDSFPP